MKTKQIILIIAILGFSITSFAQKYRWPYKVKGSKSGEGIPATYSAINHSLAAAYKKEDSEKEARNKKIKKPGIIHYYYKPFDAQQLMIIENLNPGAISKIEVGYQLNPFKYFTKEVYTATAKAEEKDYMVRNVNFDMIKNVTDVWIYMDYSKVDGINQLSAVALTNFEKPFTPYINTPDYDVFEGEAFYMNDDVSGRAAPTTPIISLNNKYIYFNHNNNGTAIYRGTIGSDGKFSEVITSKFNLTDKESTVSGIRSVSQDNNTAFVTAYEPDKLALYKVYLRKNLFGKYKWKHDKISVSGYSSEGESQNEIFSYDGKYLIAMMTQKKGEYKNFASDIYVAFRKKEGKYSKFIRMGNDINTIKSDQPCYLAPDNKTFYFASSGRLGYGSADLFMTRRLDDTWTNWSQPVNLGKMINSAEYENYFAIDAEANYAYFIRWDDGEDFSNL